jgi:hypothetical protein
MLRLGAGQHTLTCSACGAPLSALKAMPVAATAAQPAVTHQPRPVRAKALPKTPSAERPIPVKRRKKRKSMLRWIAEEAFDLVEDIFD